MNTLSSISLALCTVLINLVDASPIIRLAEKKHWNPQGMIQRDLKVAGNTGYTAGGLGNAGVLAYDLSDVNNVKLVGGYKVEEEIWKIILFYSDTLYAVGPRKVWAFDRTDPKKLILKGSATHGRAVGFEFLHLAVLGDALYFSGMSSTTSDLVRFNIAERFAPAYVGTFQKPGRNVHTMIFREEFGFYHHNGWRYYFTDETGLKTNDLPVPSEPLSVTEKWYQTNAAFNSVTQLIIRDSHTGFTAKGTNLNVIFKKQMEGPRGELLYDEFAWSWATFTLDSPIVEMKLSGGNILYVLTQRYLAVYNVATLTPVLLTRHFVQASAIFVTTKGVFYITVSKPGFSRYDYTTEKVLSNSFPVPQCTVVAHLTPDGTTVRFYTVGVEIYRPGLVDMVFYPHMEQVLAFASVGTQLYVSSAKELLVLDISSTPRLVERVLLPDVRKICVVGDFAYFACGFKGLVVMNIGGSIMRKVGRFSTAGPLESVVVSGTTAYLVDRRSLQVLDVCEPSSPKLLGKLDIVDANDVLVKDKTAYVSASSNMLVVDVGVPSEPAFHITRNGCYSVAIAENALFCMVRIGPSVFYIVIHDISLPRVPDSVDSGGVFYLRTGSVHAVGNHLAVIGETATVPVLYPMWKFTISGHTPPPMTSYGIGCFADYRALKSRSVAAYTPQQCFALCNTAGHTHAGTLFTSECWCGRASELAQSVRTNAADCATSGHRNMAVKSSVRFSHVGCFEDNVGRTAYVSAGMSVEHCAAYCGGDTVRNYKFFGIQKGDTCWCTQDIRSKPPAASGDCNAPCIGNGEAFCGGTFRSNMYALNSMDFTVGVVTASETYAESSHSFPIEVEYWDGSVQVVGSVAAPAQGSVHVMTATGILQHPRKVRIRAQGGDGWKIRAVTMTFAGLGANWFTDGVLGKVVKNTPGSEVVEWTAPPGSS